MDEQFKRQELKNWKFTLDQTEYGLGAGWANPEYDDSCWTDVEAYTSWETYELALADYEGHGWFRTWVDTENADGMRYILKFDGIGGVAQIYINGHLAHRSENRHLPFTVDMTQYMKKGKNLVAVLVDNSWRGPDHLPGGKRIEWVLYGGLTHRIWFEVQPAAYISHVRADAGADGQVKVTATVHNRDTRASIPPFCGSVTVAVAGCVAEKPVELGPGEVAKLQFCLQAEDVKTWSPDAPNLYDLTVTMKKDHKDHYTVTERIGFRTIEVQGTKILLNGQEILLKGANRYDEYVPYGICPPEALVREDFLKMKACGLNLIRTHYPQDVMHYRLADELGMLIMTEVTLNWWYPPQDKTFADFCGLATEAVDQLDRTFQNFCNHPCWVVWSVGNECSHSHPACQQMFRMLAERMRSLDCGRLVTYAANKPLLNSQELDFVDFVGMNCYNGILSESIRDFPEQIAASLEQPLKNAQALYPDKPHVITEFGSVCIRGIRGSATEGRFTEDFCSTFMRTKWAELMKDPQIKGMVIWCWADYRHQRLFLPSKAGIGLQVTYGPFGLVTMDRKPKQLLLDTMTELYTGWKLEE